MSEERNHSRWRIAALTIVVLLVFYPFSVGPVVWLEGHGLFDRLPDPVLDAIGDFYAPLLWLDRQTEAEELEWYLELWGIGDF